jgi:prevent-host-death family protein
MIEVSIRELKSRLSEHLRRVGRGESITITRRGKPVGVIMPAGAENESATASKMRELVARGVVSWSGEPPFVPEKRIKLTGDGPTMSEMVIADRG